MVSARAPGVATVSPRPAVATPSRPSAGAPECPERRGALTPSQGAPRVRPSGPATAWDDQRLNSMGRAVCVAISRRPSAASAPRPFAPVGGSGRHRPPPSLSLDGGPRRPYTAPSTRRRDHVIDQEERHECHPAQTLTDRRLVAHLAADEPAVNARIVAELYLADPQGRCRPAARRARLGDAGRRARAARRARPARARRAARRARAPLPPRPGRRPPLRPPDALAAPRDPRAPRAGEPCAPSSARSRTTSPRAP